MTAVANPSRARTNWIGFQTMVFREFHRIVRIWGQTIVPPGVTATLYFIIFGSLIGSRIGQMGGYDYMQYIAPGLIMMSVITNSYGNVVASFFGARFGKHIEEILVSPLPNWLIIAGYIAGGIVRGVLVGLVVMVVALFFTHLHVHHVLVIIASVLLTSIVFSLGGFINAMFAKNFDHISWFPTFILTPLTYLGGVFYSISLLPASEYASDGTQKALEQRYYTSCRLSLKRVLRRLPGLQVLTFSRFCQAHHCVVQWCCVGRSRYASAVSRSFWIAVVAYVLVPTMRSQAGELTGWLCCCTAGRVARILSIYCP